jgi:cytochrome c biogenesis protein CcmG, thiol:disulfide interchange protein DsbE
LASRAREDGLVDATVPPSSTGARRLLRVAAVLLPAAAFIALLAFGLLRADGPPAPGDAAPGFSGDVLGDDRTLALAELRGAPVVLNFWASWCGPCRDEAPILNAAVERYGGRVHVVGVNVRDSRPEAIDFARDYDYAFPSVVDGDGRIYDDYGLTGQPETFVIDADGKVFRHIQGPFLSEEDLFGQIEGALGRDG